MPSGESAKTEVPPSLTARLNTARVSTEMPTATIGAVNRPGNSAPRENASAQTGGSDTAPAANGQIGGPPQGTACASLPYKTATPMPKAATTQAIVPANEHSCRVPSR